MADKCRPEGPTDGGYNGSKGPGEALKMPTKSYPASSRLGDHPGKDTTIDSPAHEGHGGYHK